MIKIIDRVLYIGPPRGSNWTPEKKYFDIQDESYTEIRIDMRTVKFILGAVSHFTKTDSVKKLLKLPHIWNEQSPEELTLMEVLDRKLTYKGFPRRLAWAHERPGIARWDELPDPMPLEDATAKDWWLAPTITVSPKEE